MNLRLRKVPLWELNVRFPTQCIAHGAVGRNPGGRCVGAAVAGKTKHYTMHDVA